MSEVLAVKVVGKEDTMVCLDRRIVVDENSSISSTGLGGVTGAGHVALAHEVALARRIADVSTVALPSKFNTSGGEASGSTSIDTLFNCHLVNGNGGRGSILEDAVACVIEPALGLIVSVVCVEDSGRPGRVWIIIFDVDIDGIGSSAGCGGVTGARHVADAGGKVVASHNGITAVAFTAVFNTSEREALSIAEGLARSGGKIVITTHTVFESSDSIDTISPTACPGRGPWSGGISWGVVLGFGVDENTARSTTELRAITEARHVALRDVEGLARVGSEVQISTVAFPSVFKTSRRETSGSTPIDALLDSHLIACNRSCGTRGEDARGV